MGRNGAGKTTLLKLIAGVLEPDGGDVRLGASLKMGYFAQQALQLLDADLTVWEQMQHDFPHESIGVLRNLLGAFQFSGDEIDKKIRSLSGGERTRLVIARMLLYPPNFLVLDEPTNHLDLTTKDMLIEALRELRGDDDLRLARPIVPARPEQPRAGNRRRDAARTRSRSSIPARTSSTSRAPATKRRACTPDPPRVYILWRARIAMRVVEVEVSMRRMVFVLASFAVVSIAAESRLSGQVQSTSLTVTASVSKNCTISTSAVNFGAYDPVAVNATAPLDGTGTVTVTCTKGAPAKVGLGTGSNPQGNTRRMAQGSAVYLIYELYRDTSRTTVWGDTADTALDIPAAPNRNPRTYTIYGRVAAAQDATVGAYTDTVLATVNF